MRKKKYFFFLFIVLQVNVNMNVNEIRAPGEKVDIAQESLNDYIQPK